jgi:hypothetical protein
VTDDGYRRTRQDELNSIVERFSRGSSEPMSSAAAMGDRLQEEYLVPAFTHVVSALAAVPPDGQAIEAGRQKIEALRDSLRALTVGTVVLNGALNTVAQGFQQVVTTIGNLPSRPAPAAFNEPDGQLTWLDRPPLEEYEAGVLSNLNIVRAAVAKYQADTDAALRGLLGFTTKPDEEDGDEPPAGGVRPVGPLPTSGPPPGGAAGFELDELASATTTPVRPRASAARRAVSAPVVPSYGAPSAFPSSGFGPIGHAAEDAAMAAEQAQPAGESGVRSCSSPPPAAYQPVILARNTEKTIFDADGPVVPPVIGG